MELNHLVRPGTLRTHEAFNFNLLLLTKCVLLLLRTIAEELTW